MPRYEEIPFISLGELLVANPTVQPTIKALATPERLAVLKSMKPTTTFERPNLAIPSQAPLMPVRPQSLPPLMPFRTPEGTVIPVKPAVGPLPPDPVRALIPKGTTFPSGRVEPALPIKPFSGPTLWPKRAKDGSVQAAVPSVASPSFISAEPVYEEAGTAAAGTQGTSSYATAGQSSFLTPEENAAMTPSARVGRFRPAFAIGVMGLAAFVWWKLNAKG